MTKEMKSRANGTAPNAAEIIVQGLSVRLVFAAEKNSEIPIRVRDILKNGYLQRQGA